MTCLTARLQLPSVGQVPRSPLVGQNDAASSIVDALDSIRVSVWAEATQLQAISRSTELTREAVAAEID